MRPNAERAPVVKVKKRELDTHTLQRRLPIIDVGGIGERRFRSGKPTSCLPDRLEPKCFLDLWLGQTAN